MAEVHKVLFTGTMGAGKTTAIKAVSGIRMVNTEAANRDQGLFAKATTTVGFDYGELELDDGSTLRLYGTPGQRRFEFMWRILARGALGLVVLVDNSRPDPMADVSMYLDNFQSLVQQGCVVVGVGRLDTHPSPTIDDYYAHLGEMGLMIPVFAADVRQPDDVLMLLDVLFSMLEAADDTALE